MVSRSQYPQPRLLRTDWRFSRGRRAAAEAETSSIVGSKLAESKGLCDSSQTSFALSHIRSFVHDFARQLSAGARPMQTTTLSLTFASAGQCRIYNVRKMICRYLNHVFYSWLNSNNVKYSLLPVPETGGAKERQRFCLLVGPNNIWRCQDVPWEIGIVIFFRPLRNVSFLYNHCFNYQKSNSEKNVKIKILI